MMGQHEQRHGDTDIEWCLGNKLTVCYLQGIKYRIRSSKNIAIKLGGAKS